MNKMLHYGDDNYIIFLYSLFTKLNFPDGILDCRYDTRGDEK